MFAFSVFALRLALGMTACLLLLPRGVVNPRYYRIQFLIVLALTGVSCVFAKALSGLLVFWVFATVAMGSALLGSLVWSLERAPGRRFLIAATLLILAGALMNLDVHDPVMAASPLHYTLADFTSAAVLGTALSAMLMGHSYLVAPTMSLRPLLILIAALAISVAARMAVDGLWLWTARRSLGNLDNDMILLLLVRWAVGFAGVFALTWMTWRTARIRSTQSATGILYVVVIFCFLGELTGQLLTNSTHLL
ncbi:MAG TPA: hypothetical protein DDY78_24990 [Planctomycetales bacterium]|jgi:hypothetical protein|nr:hypothetical protein [Planctomycetales bacterium]